MSYRALSDLEWARIASYLPLQHMGRPRSRDREILNALLYILSSSCPWCDLPTYFPPKSTVHRRFKLWQQCGFFQQVLSALRHELPESSVYYLDSTLVEAKKGGSNRQSQSSGPRQQDLPGGRRGRAAG